MLLQQVHPQLLRPPVLIGRAAAGGVIEGAFCFVGHAFLPLPSGFHGSARPGAYRVMKWLLPVVHGTSMARPVPRCAVVRSSSAVTPAASLPVIVLGVALDTVPARRRASRGMRSQRGDGAADSSRYAVTFISGIRFLRWNR